MLNFITLLWAGEILGTSFVATIVKFQATQYRLSIPQLLAVGKVTFSLQNTIDIGMISIIGVWAVYRYIWATPLPLIDIVLYAVVLILILIQTFYILPILDVRTLAHIQNNPMPPSHHHIVFATIEAAKICALLVIVAKNLLFK